MLKENLAPYLDSLKSRSATNREVARALGVSETYLSRVLGKMGFVKDAPQSVKERQRQHELFAARIEHRQHVAKTLPAKEAAKAANCSLRTISRWKSR